MPVGLPFGCRKARELVFGGREQFVQVLADGFEGAPGVRVALALPAAVGGLVQRPALVVGVLVGVVVPLLQNVRGGAGVDGELVEDELVVGGVERGAGLPGGVWCGGAGVQRWTGDGTGAGVSGARALSAAAALRCLWAAARATATR